MTHWEFSHLPFDGDITDDKIVCQNCGWSWKVKDGGNDLYVCHKCNTDNSDYYLRQNEIKSNFAVSPELIAGAVTGLTTAVGSIAQASASNKMSESELKKEVSVVCGKRRPKLNKKKKAEYDSCVKGIRGDIDSRTNQTRTQEQERQEQQKQLFSQNRKDKQNQTYLIIGIITVILGIVIYKKMNK